MKIIECPRDAMQGLVRQIPTRDKADYLNQLLRVGFHTLDFGSFVSPRAVPQMRDTRDVLGLLDLQTTSTRLLAIVANVRGAQATLDFPEITYLGFPLSISETFQQRNTNQSVQAAFELVPVLNDICMKSGRELVVYLSMGFGNPYGDPYSVDRVLEFVSRLDALEIPIVSLSDTMGQATSEAIRTLFDAVVPSFPKIEFGAHLHAFADRAIEKVKAARQGGCQRLDGALLGYGGCPMAADELVGNIDTELILSVTGYDGMDLNEFGKAKEMATTLFMTYGN
ncbi:MAG: hydroxymethylglutaryl-CoA lyase [Cyclobacteriaceae bacterium]|nr:hydroxymethylglutaryl-CoA lyase [Cyclobacteriaceae bacterium]